MGAFATAQGQSVAFYFVFGFAIIAFVALCVIVVVKVVTKDRAARKVWLAAGERNRTQGTDVTPK